MAVKDRLTRIQNYCFDRIWSYHICSIIFFSIAAAMVATVLYLLIPMWQYAPIYSSCQLFSKSTEYQYIGTEYVTFKEYRARLYVNYTGPGGQTMSSVAYGPENDEDPNVNARGFSLSLYETNQFFSQYTVGQVYPCWYSLPTPELVSVTYNPILNLVLVLPFPFLFIGVICFVLPWLYSWYWKKRKEDEYMKDFMLFDARRSQQKEQDRVSASHRDNKMTSMFQVSQMYFGDVDPDEEPYEVVSIENIGNFLPTQGADEVKEEPILNLGGDDEEEIKMSWA